MTLYDKRRSDLDVLADTATSLRQTEHAKRLENSHVGIDGPSIGGGAHIEFQNQDGSIAATFGATPSDRTGIEDGDGNFISFGQLVGGSVKWARDDGTTTLIAGTHPAGQWYWVGPSVTIELSGSTLWVTVGCQHSIAGGNGTFRSGARVVGPTVKETALGRALTSGNNGGSTSIVTAASREMIIDGLIPGTYVVTMGHTYSGAVAPFTAVASSQELTVRTS